MRNGPPSTPDLRIVDLLDRFAGREPLDAAESAATEHLMRFLRSAHEPFARSTLPVHVTASAVVLDPVRGLVLLHLHRRLARWLQPGGHIEPGERPQDAAVRETTEETAVAVRHPVTGPFVVHLDEHPGPDGHVHLDLRYLLLADLTAPTVGAGETTGVGPGPTLRWEDAEGVATHADPSLARAAAALQLQPHLLPGPIGPD